MALVPAQASSSCCFSNTWNSEYDVFISFRGEDTRDGFVGTLRSILKDKGINTFIDDEDLRKGDEISPELVKAIEGSRMYIIVFSENYASSAWCLDELVKIVDCMQLRGQLVLPVFYKIAPSQVRKQTGSYEKALTDHENKFGDNVDRVKKWRSALTREANYCGWHYVSGYEIKLIQEIVDEVSGRLNRHFLHVAANPVGLDWRISQVISQLGLMCIDDVRMVGIYGIGGIGKSTIARAVYNMIAPQFDGASFLSDVRETSSERGGLVYLQEKLLSDIPSGKKIEFGDVYRGINVIRERLSRKKILLIIDDVDDLKQVQALAGMQDGFGPGSRIIITTRDKQLLAAHNVSSVYEVEILTKFEALELFSWHAFRKREPDAIYMNISECVVDYCECLPLAIEVIGRGFVGKRLEEWEATLRRYRSVPEGKIHKKLKISYDDLDYTEQQTFLHIACFFKGENLEYVRKILEACDLYPISSISKLIDRGLLSVDSYGNLCMHNLIQDMGKEIVRNESPSNAGKRSRVWFYDDAIQVLTQNLGTHNVEGIMLNPTNLSKIEELEWGGKAFKKMKNLKILIIKHVRFSAAPTYLPNSLRLLHWEHYPSSSFPPSGFYPKNLVVLKVPHGHLTLQKPFKEFLSLTRMDFSRCNFISKVPDLSGVPNLAELVLDSCENLVEVHNSVGSLGKLVTLIASRCRELTSLPQGFRLKSLKELSLMGCTKLHSFPDIMEIMENVRFVDISYSGIEELPSSIQKLSSLEDLYFVCCERLKFVPSTISLLQKLDRLDSERTLIRNSLLLWSDSSEGCSAISPRSHDFNVFNNIRVFTLTECNLLDEHLSLIPRFFPSLEILSLKGNPFERIPCCFRELQCLEQLDLSDCRKLHEFPDIIPCMPKLLKIYTWNCTKLSPQSAKFILEVGKRFVQPENNRTGGWITVPGTRVPDWTVHRSKGRQICFYARGKLPKILFSIAFEIDAICFEDYTWRVRLFINRESVTMSTNLFARIEGNNHVCLFDCRRLFPCGMLEGLIRRDNWNHVKIRYTLYINYISDDFFEGAKGIVKECGIHLCEEENNMEDICFSCPPDCQEPQQLVSDEEENPIIFSESAKKQLEERANSQNTESNNGKKRKRAEVPFT